MLVHNCIDIDRTDDYNVEEYFHRFIRDTDLSDVDDPELGPFELVARLALPPIPTAYTTKGFKVWIGADIGYTSDPTEILIGVEYHPSAEELAEDKEHGRARPRKGFTRIRMIGRITLRRIPGPLQAAAVMHLVAHYNPTAFSLDGTGNGLPLVQFILSSMRAAAGQDARARKAVEAVRGYNFSEHVLVEIFDPSAEKVVARKAGTATGASADDIVDEAGIRRPVLEYSTDKLREVVDQGRWMMPWDKDAEPSSIVDEFHGQTFSYSNSPMDAYGRKRRIFAEGRFHTLDAARMLITGWAQEAIEAFVAAEPVQESVIDRPL